MKSPLVDQQNKYQKVIDKALKTYFPPADAYTHQVREAMEYSLFAGGKRVRPMLCLMACKIVGGSESEALPAACALEYIHTYSLIHDDLPALDNDDYRRGHLTCHRKFGEATAILAGDGLLTEAFSLMSRKELMKNLGDGVRLEIIQEVARAAGIRGMVAGQEADLAAEKKKISLDKLRFIHQHKTGALITASLVCGALAGNGKKDELKALKKYGEKIGLVFQIKDDLLNVEGEARLMGKRTGTDEKKSKATYPLLMGLEPSKELGRKLLFEAKKALRIFGERSLPLIQMGEFFFSRDK